MKEFASLKNANFAMEIGNGQFFGYYSSGCYEEKNLHQKLESYKFKQPLKN